MIKKIKKLCRLLCLSALIGILLFPGQVMADRGGNSCRVTLPVSVIYRNQNSADSRVFEYVLSAKESGGTDTAGNGTLYYSLKWSGQRFVWSNRIYGTRGISL